MWLEVFDIYNKIPLDENDELEKYLEEVKTIEEEKKDIKTQYKRILVRSNCHLIMQKLLNHHLLEIIFCFHLQLLQID